MKLAVISSSPFVCLNHKFHAYAPYVNELEIWARHSDEISFACPQWDEDCGLLIKEINFPVANYFRTTAFHIKSFSAFVRAVGESFRNFSSILKAMAWADHIHLRCPGNIGLMGCIAQIFYPNKPKTAKYAGNWDPKAQQPLSYRLQKWILANTFLTRNMKVLVYGNWPGSSRNILPFFTASYSEIDKTLPLSREQKQRIDFVFVGTLAKGKRTIYAIKLVERLRSSGLNVTLSIYGHGREKQALLDHIMQNGMAEFIFLEGNRPAEEIKEIYRKSDFLILPSQSEGWPKVVAEAMFFGCIPLASSVSCVPDMLAGGRRGLLLEMDLDADAAQITQLLGNPQEMSRMSREAAEWSREYTLESFERAIASLLNQSRHV